GGVTRQVLLMNSDAALTFAPWRLCGGSGPLLPRKLRPAVFEDGEEGAGAEFFQRDAGGDGFLFRQRAAIDAAEEEIEQALAGGGIVEDRALQRCLRGLGDEVAQPRRRRRQALVEEAVGR